MSASGWLDGDELMEDEQIMKAIIPGVRQLMAMAAKAAETTVKDGREDG